MDKFWKTAAAMLVMALVLGACSAPPAAVELEPSRTMDVDFLVNAMVAATVDAVKTELAADCEARVITATPKQTEVATATPAPGMITPTAGGAAGWDVATFLSDITIPDGVSIPPGTRFKKTWALRNDGVTTWSGKYELIFLSGDQLGSPAAQALVINPVAPGEMGLISVELLAPEKLGKYIGFWKMRSPDGTVFGVGADNRPLYTEINVAKAYYFLDNLCSASWSTGENLLYCPSVEGDKKGWYTTYKQLTMENGIAASPSLVMAPPQENNSQIVGRFRPIKIFPGARLQSLVGCQFGYPNCKVKMKITYTTTNDIEVPLAEYAEYYDGFTQEVNINLQDLGLVGQEIGINFYVLTDGGPEDDMSFWFNPRITD